MAKDLHDVLQQMRSHGLTPPPGVDLQGAFKRYLRFRPEGDKRNKKSAWVRLFEFRSPQSDRVYITGAFGNRGDQWSVEATATDWTPAERAAWIAHKREAEKAAQAERQSDADAAAAKAERMWKAGHEPDLAATHPYLERKHVSAFGVRMGFNQRLLVPLRTVTGQLRGLQYISADGEKIFGTGTAKEGMSHLLGELSAEMPVLAFGEGYATCATVHMAMGWPVVCCFDAGNLAPVMAEYRRLYPELAFVVMADDDRHLLPRLAGRLAKLGIACTPDELRENFGREWAIPDGPRVTLRAGWKADICGVMRLEGTLAVDGAEQRLMLENAGQAKAHAAARRFKARVLTPFFADRSSPHTDWNDLHCSAGLDSAREQITAGMEAPPEKPRANGGAAARGKRVRDGAAAGGGDGAEQPGRDWEGDVPFLERFTLIYGTTTVWDALQREIMRIEALKVAYGKRVDWWLSHSERRMVPQANVVFDPSGKSRGPEYVNLFDRLPLDPLKARDKCQRIVEHLWNLCHENDALCHWVTAWLAYPLQNPGAKMRTALVLHGRTEGTGKSMLGAVMRAVYGRYCTSVGQAELQRDFNDWMSAKLLILAEEVVSRQELTHLQGALQALITQPTVQINTKNMPIREEANRAQFIFFSNQQVPVRLNPRDRRYTVIRVEEERPAEYFAEIQSELENGGGAAFYEYLLTYDLQGFNEFTRPFENKDRLHLITLGMTPDQRFFSYWQGGFSGVPFVSCTASDLYAAFKAWCRVNGERFVPTATAFGRTMSEEFERLGAPPKRTVRYEAYSDKQVAEGDWSGSYSSRQGVVYFVPATLEMREAHVSGEPAAAPSTDPPADVTERTYVGRCIRLFQERLHELLGSARRSL